jgi:hypothetical protein
LTPFIAKDMKIEASTIDVSLPALANQIPATQASPMYVTIVALRPSFSQKYADE